MKDSKISAKIWTGIFCFIFYELLTCSASAREILLGIIFSVITAVFASRFFIHEDTKQRMWNPMRLLMICYYAVVPFMKELILANVDVAFRVFEKDMKVNPGIVKIPVDLKSEYALSMLANSITLTPGTITMDVEEDEDGNNFFYVHKLDVTTEDEKENAEIIKGAMEPWIRRIWE